MSVRLGDRARLLLFAALAVAQLAVPAWMIIARERVLARGEAFKFRTAPVDPYDAFRGRFVALDFELDRVPEPPGVELERGDWFYLVLGRDDQGFASLAAARTEPPDEEPYLRLRVRWINEHMLHFDLPFDRYYLNERLAPDAEAVYRESNRRQTRDAWAVVRVRAGRGVLEELYVDGLPILEAVRARAADPARTDVD